MAKLKGTPGTGKGWSLSRNLIYQVDRGQLKVQSWPRKRGRPKSPITREQNEWFRQANLVAKYAPGDDQWMAIEIAKGGPWYPRDLLMSAMRGRLFEVLIIDGQEYRAMAVNEDVSSDLDFLAGNVEGTIIVRGPNLWQGLVPGAAGLILTSQGVADMPAWDVPGGASGRYIAETSAITGWSAIAFATIGYPFRASRAFTINGLSANILGGVGETYKGYVFEVDSGMQITAIAGETPDIASLGAFAWTYQDELSAPALIVAGNRYIIAWGRIDGADTYTLQLRLKQTAVGFIGLPEIAFGITSAVNLRSRLAKAVPTVGDTFTNSVAGAVHLRAEIGL